MSAELSAVPDKTIATVRMYDSAQHLTVWTWRIEADRKDADVLPDRVGAQVAATLPWTAIVRELDPRDPQLTAKLLQLAITRDDLQNYQNAARVAGQAPESGMAQLSLAMYTSFALDALPRDQRAEAVAAARRAADRAKSILPHFGDVYIPYCLLHPFDQFAECEDSLRTGLRADPDAPFVNYFLSALLSDVGRTKEAVDRARLSYQHDPYMPAKISQMLRALEIAGDTNDAESLYVQGLRWWPDWPFFRNRVRGILERGDFDELRRVDREPGALGYGPGHPDSRAVVEAVKASSVEKLRQTCIDAKNSFYAYPCLFGFLRLGDMDSAFALIGDSFPQGGRTPAEQEQTWLNYPSGEPTDVLSSAAAAPMRRDPRFIALVERTGLLAYWRSRRLPDFCQPPHEESVCAQLRK